MLISDSRLFAPSYPIANVIYINERTLKIRWAVPKKQQKVLCIRLLSLSSLVLFAARFARGPRPFGNVLCAASSGLLEKRSLFLFLGSLAAPEPLAKRARTLADHVRVHDVETGPPDDKEKEDGVVGRGPSRRVGPWQHLGQRLEHQHGFGASAERVENVKERVSIFGIK